MVWQDILISVANVLFSYSLIHQVYHGFKKKEGAMTLTASSLTTIGLYAFSFAFYTLGLYASTIISIFNGTLWLTLFIQRIIYQKK